MRKIMPVAAILAVAGVIAGCAAESPDDFAHRATQAPDSSSQNRSLWALPLDEFRLSGSNTANYAEQLLIRPCLEERGYSWPVPWQEIDVAPTATLTIYGARLFDRDIAQEQGYHPGAIESESAKLWDEFLAAAGRYRDLPEFEPVFDDCVAKAREGNPLPSMDEQMYVSNLAIDAAGRAALEPTVVAAAERWRECMMPLGIADLPDVPQEMPSPSLSERFGLTTFGLPDQPRGGSTHPSEEEVRIATADADCRESSSYSEELYQAQWRFQQEAVARERTKLERIRDELFARNERTLEIIAENAPEAP